MRVLIAGCGYVGLPLGTELARQGHEVFGLRRTAGAAAEIEGAGLRLLVGDITKTEDLARLPPSYDWVRVHQTLRETSAMDAGLTDHLGPIPEILKTISI